MDLSRLGNGERNSAEPKAREGRASGRERVHPVGILRRNAKPPGRREAFGVRVALAPPSDETRNSTQLVAPKSDEGGRREDAKAQGKPVSFSACPPRMNLLDKTAKLVRTDCNAMKPTFFTTSLLFLALSSVACVAEAR